MAFNIILFYLTAYDIAKTEKLKQILLPYFKV